MLRIVSYRSILFILVYIFFAIALAEIIISPASVSEVQKVKCEKQQSVLVGMLQMSSGVSIFITSFFQAKVCNNKCIANFQDSFVYIMMFILATLGILAIIKEMQKIIKF